MRPQDGGQGPAADRRERVATDVFNRLDRTYHSLLNLLPFLGLDKHVQREDEQPECGGAPDRGTAPRPHDPAPPPPSPRVGGRPVEVGVGAQGDERTAPSELSESSAGG